MLASLSLSFLVWMAPLQRHVYKLFSLKRGSVCDQELAVLFLWLRTIRTALRHFVEEDFLAILFVQFYRWEKVPQSLRPNFSFTVLWNHYLMTLFFPSWEYLLVLLVGLVSKKCTKIIFFMFTNFQERFVWKLCWHKPTNRSVHPQYLVQSYLFNATQWLCHQKM